MMRRDAWNPDGFARNEDPRSRLCAAPREKELFYTGDRLALESVTPRAVSSLPADVPRQDSSRNGITGSGCGVILTKSINPPRCNGVTRESSRSWETRRTSSRFGQKRTLLQEPQTRRFCFLLAIPVFLNLVSGRMPEILLITLEIRGLKHNTLILKRRLVRRQQRTPSIPRFVPRRDKEGENAISLILGLSTAIEGI